MDLNLFQNTTFQTNSSNTSNATLQNNVWPEEYPFDCWNIPYTPVANIIVAIILSFMMVADLFGNTLVVLAYVTYPKLKTTTNCFICGLAIADILVACFGMPFWLYYTLDKNSMAHNWVNDLYICFDVVVSVSSIGHLMFIGIDRYYAVTSPINHRMRMTSTKVKIIIAGIWVFSISTSFISLIKKEQFQYNHMMIMIVGFAVPLVVLVFCYTKILHIAISRLRKQKNRDKKLQKELRSARTVGVVTGTFFICWLPFNIVSQYFIYCGEECFLPLCPLNSYILVSSVKLLHYFNSCVNPAIYAYFSRSYRQAFQGLFVRYCKRKYSSNERMEVDASTDDQDLLTRMSRVSRRVRNTLKGKQQNQRTVRSRLEAGLALSMYENDQLNESMEDSPETEQQTSFTSIRYAEEI